MNFQALYQTFILLIKSYLLKLAVTGVFVNEQLYIKSDHPVYNERQALLKYNVITTEDVLTITTDYH